MRYKKYVNATEVLSLAVWQFSLLSLATQSIKSCNAKRRRQRKQPKTISRSSQQNNNFAHAAHFFVHFFAIILHYYNEKLPETSWLHVLCAPVHFFCGCRCFSPWWPLACPFSHRCYKIFMFFFQRNWSPLFFISRSSSFSVIHVNVDIKIKWEERIGFAVVVFISKRLGSYAI